MTNESTRFLALNAVLHGHNILNVFEDSLPAMADCLCVTVEEAEKLCKGLESVSKLEILEDPLVFTFLNYFRNSSYAFVAIGSNVVPLNQFLQTDLSGQVSDELRYAYLMQLVKDVIRGDSYVIPFIKDGVLHCTPEDFDRVEQCILEAYQMYMSGPSKATSKLIKALQKHTSIEDYNKLSATALVKILEQIVKCKVNPILYQRTLLDTADLFTVYSKTGCIMCLGRTDKNTIYWLLDVEGTDDTSIVVSETLSKISSNIKKSVRDLSKTKAVIQPNGRGKIVFAEVL